MFSRARWRLTLWFVGALALILTVTGAAVYLTAHTLLFNQVDDDLRSRSGREEQALAARLLTHHGDAFQDLPIGPAFTAGGYWYALVRPTGELLVGTSNVDPNGLAGPDALRDAMDNGNTFADTKSSDGDSLRVYLTALTGPRGTRLVMQVGRSTEPETEALNRLLLILIGGGGAGVLLALAGGFFLAGRTLAPIRTAMDRQRAFVADASHELRTPLSLIRASAELLKRQATKSGQTGQASLDDIIQETDRLNGLVGQMLTLARADADQAPLSQADVDLNQLTADTARQMRLLAEPRNTTIDLQMDGPITVKGDPTRLRELLTILLDNAVKYSDPGAAVQVRLQPLPGKAQIKVSDNGPGIPAEAMPHIFDRFYRVDKARSREMGGAGLGLAIAKWIVDSHDGTIRVDSAPAAGTTVTVELPAHVAEARRSSAEGQA